ncbi:TPA: hypothetical protein VJE86_000757 [Streptococcus pyogenes]|nr:hypothetical protein WH79_07370 [Streptococcus dysgalactiae subsp. equisimilis]NTS58311.1 hypothetical protein [Streptococcus pyogenes]OBZ03350.1 hypothetical protein BBG04_09565 [Streptococcus dysgalactiae subsp. equisimilis]OCX02725.1 hypothetical protein BBG07_01205 [Streptococcus dysgalactiae subsp. equisimilis]HEP1535234.1 hypothetical protein [Streptococcus pyogenes]
MEFTIKNNNKENKVKKKLVMALTLCLSICAISVRANEEVAESDLFITKGQSHLPGVSVKPFKVGDNKINVNLEPYGYVETTVTHGDGISEKVKAEDRTITVKCPTNYECTDRSYKVSGYRAGGDGNYTVELEKSLEEEDVVTLSFMDDGSMYFGQLVYETKKAQNTRLQEEKKVEEQRKAEEEQKQLEDSMIKHIQEEAKKTWYQRLGDSIQDQWWNFKGWLRG